MAGVFSGLTDIQWEKLSGCIPEIPCKRGRPKESRRKLLNTVLYVLITGCRWCDIPCGEIWAKRSTAHEWLGIWSKDGTLTKLRQVMLGEAELHGLINWERGSIDGSFAAGKGGGEGVDYGFKGKGVTLHTLVDGNGMPLAIINTSAKGSEREQVLPLLEKANVRSAGKKRGRNCPKAVQMDKGYDAQSLREQIRSKGVRPMIPRRRVKATCKQRRGRKPPQLIDRWKVERTFSWIQRKFRRLCIRWERRTKYWIGLLEFAISFMWLDKVLVAK
jgi:transposase